MEPIRFPASYRQLERSHRYFGARHDGGPLFSNVSVSIPSWFILR
jgi:hypothetical protein